jgi:hypothetical protein
MPQNRFPDSRGKRELRRQDGRRLQQFKAKHQKELGLEYCGMPSVEFLDVIAWQGALKSVQAVEFDPDNLEDMKIQWNIVGLGMPILYQPGDILDFLRTAERGYDVYNLDFYGGFVHGTTKGATPRCPDAIRALIARQGTLHRSFVLIATFSARDSGAKEYLAFIDEVPGALAGYQNVEAGCASHKKSNLTRLKLCFPYFCWLHGMANNFAVSFEDPVIYKSSATMLHFYMEFTYQAAALPKLTSTDILIDIANRPMRELDEQMVETVAMFPAQITKN